MTSLHAEDLNDSSNPNEGRIDLPFIREETFFLLSPRSPRSLFPSFALSFSLFLFQALSLVLSVFASFVLSSHPCAVLRVKVVGETVLHGGGFVDV